MDTLQITLFGHVTVVRPNVSGPLKLSHSIQAVLAYLLLQQHLVPRDVLMEVFWIDYPPDRARSNLTTALWRLRQLLEPDEVQPGTYLISKNTGEIGFNWESGHWLDTESFEQRIHPLLRKPISALDDEDIKQFEEVLVLYRGELLEGMYEDWALRERERFRSLHFDCLNRLMEFHTSKGNLDQSITYAQEILRRDPLREEIHRDLMRIYLQSGRRALAIRQYAQCREHLSQELGVLPLEETEALYQQIVASPLPPSSPNGLPLAQELAQLSYELQLVKQSLDETTKALANINQVVSRLMERNDSTLGRTSRRRH